MRWIEQYAKTLCHSDICKLSSLELVTVQCAASTIFNCFYVMYTPKTLNSLVDGFIYPLKHMRWAGTWRIREKSHSSCVFFWFIFEEKSTWFYSVEYLHACVFRLMYKYVCLFLHPWHRCDVFVRSQCRMDDFPSDETIFITIFLLSPLLLLLL